MSGAAPNLFIVGAMKAGTTALHGYLDRHPDIFMSDPKEPDFFADPEPDAAARDAYLSLFTRGADQRWRSEASTRYTKARDAAGVAGRIAQLAPEARILYMVRDPVARTVSQYLFNRRIHAERRPICRAVQEAFSAAFAAMADAVPQDARARLAAIATLHEQDIYRRFMWALRLHHPDLVDTWIPGTLFYCRQSLPRHLLNLWAFWRVRRRAEHVLRKEKT